MRKLNALSPFVATGMTLGFLFLYIPIVLLIVFSFNESRLVTVWGGFSTKWYGSLLQNQQVIDATLLSLRIAALNATIATVLGTLASLALVRFGRFRGRALMSEMIAALLVMPEVILGLSLLLLFVSMQGAIGWPGQRGFLTILIAHATFSTAYVTVIVQSRLAGMDRSFEEAAYDLGANAFTVFRTVTLPMIAPSLVAGWLLAFILSFDDLVIASFASGPSATTLPMVIFSKVRFGISPEINALATIIVVTVALFVVLAGVLLQRQNKQRLKAAGRG